jgi:hypothetical protein
MSIYIGNVVVHIERDNEGYISLSTDGWPVDDIKPIIDALRAIQTDNDRECEAAMNAGRSLNFRS